MYCKKLKLPFFWYLMLRQWVMVSGHFEVAYFLHFKGRWCLERIDLSTPKDKYTTLTRNVRIGLPGDATSYPRRIESSSSPLCKPQKWRQNNWCEDFIIRFSEQAVENDIGLSQVRNTFLFLWLFGPISGHGLPLRGFAIILSGHITLGRTSLDEWSARRRDLYLTTHNTHKRQTSIHSAGFEPTLPASVRPQANALDRAATGTVYQICFIYSK